MSGVTPEDRQAAVDILFAHNLITGQRILRIKAGDFDDIAAVQVASQIRQAAYAAGVAAERERAAGIAENHQPQHEMNTALSRQIGSNIAAEIRSET